MSVTGYVVPDDLEQGAVRLMQAALLGIAAYGVYSATPGMVFNGLLPLAITLIPGYLREDRNVRVETGLTFLITAAVLVHAVGALGPYKQYGWYDQFAHGLSATVVALTGYVFVRAIDLASDENRLPRRFVQVYVVLAVMAFGVVWEVMEYGTSVVAKQLGMSGVLIQFGWEDIVLDLAFDLVGGVLVALVGARYLSATPEDIAEEMDEELEATVDGA
ncbi:hypothetical protein ACFO0N_16590 [Halobium salinum]|uniref:DUF2238 domain-containing protein n=1 Tax=Halobium salinum TaxID=1364940 RepID=A0ABD5PFU1_9EURY|nr:hypothetical protein [Halobium salinum]